MVDTLVLGTSAKAWEFESLHAHHTFFFTKKKKVGKKEKNILACKYNYKPFVLSWSFNIWQNFIKSFLLSEIAQLFISQWLLLVYVFIWLAGTI